MLKGILIVVFCFVVFLIIHFAIFHNHPRIKKRFEALLIMHWSLLPIYTLVHFLTPNFLLDSTSPMIVGFLNGILIYTLLFFVYYHFYCIIDRSISVRTMIELESSCEKQLTIEQVKKVYNLDNLLSRRLEEMMRRGYIAQNSDYYKNTRKGHYQAQLFQFLKEYLRLGPGG